MTSGNHINNGLLDYTNETIFNIDNGTHWVLSKSIINSHTLSDLSNDITCNNCQLHFENITVEITVTNNGTFITNQYSILSLQNVCITSRQYNNNNNILNNVFIHWLFNNNAQFICIILVVFIAIYIAKYFKSKETEPIPMRSQIPDPNIKCDAYDNNGKCIIYVPYSAQQYTLNAEGINNELNDYECTNFLWD